MPEDSAPQPEFDMEYDIIEKVAELASGNHGDELAEVAARLLMNTFSFDFCAIYIWNEETGVFDLSASCGDETNCLEAYPAGEGVPALVKERLAPVVFTGRVPAGVAPTEEPFDRGMEGFASAAAFPLMWGAAFRGVLYCKSRESAALTGTQRRALEVAAKTLMAGLMNEEHRAKFFEARSELLDTQARLAESEKLLALVDMASTLAHEIRSPLISIGGFTARLRKKLRTGDSALRYVVRIESETARLENLMNGMMRFIRETPVELAEADINEVLEDALGFFSEDLLVHSITVHRRMHKGPLRVLVDRVQIKIAFDNLIVNAIQSMKSGGTLDISTERGQGRVLAIFKDTGGGISPEDMENIFNPFFTTKSCGTGLGLPITKSIIARHNGTITVDNNAGVGVSFSISLPEAPEGGVTEEGRG